MPHILREIRVLRDEGKLHDRLVRRVRTLLIISCILLVAAILMMFSEGGNPAGALALLVVGFLLGMFLFARMTPVAWNRDTEKVEAGSLGAIGWIMIGAYVLFEIVTRTILARFAGAEAEGYILSAICGVLSGRAIGTLVEIHRVYAATHAR